jgi:16S rRNA (guanine966-N2)-methyltransferase
MKRSYGELRIIGGRLRGRKWRIPDVTGLRPTPNRVRETLFNWLAPHIAGSRVLDLFAGSGALGFEALSRGAASAVLVEQDRAVLDMLRTTAAQFGLTQARIEGGESLAFLHGQAPESFDVVFLDPPFGAGLLVPALRRLGERKLLAPGGFCHVEQASAATLPQLPAGWSVHRSGKAGDVGYHLLHAPQSDIPRDL